MANQYRRGADLERALVRYLRSQGWEAARSASSKSAVDVWAVKDGSLELFQCSVRLTPAKLRAVKGASERIGHPIRLCYRGEHGLPAFDATVPLGRAA